MKAIILTAITFLMTPQLLRADDIKPSHEELAVKVVRAYFQLQYVSQSLETIKNEANETLDEVSAAAIQDIVSDLQPVLGAGIEELKESMAKLYDRNAVALASANADWLSNMVSVSALQIKRKLHRIPAPELNKLLETVLARTAFLVNAAK